MKPALNDKGEKEIDVIPAHQALQIAGRAGRYGTEYGDGEVSPTVVVVVVVVMVVVVVVVMVVVVVV